MAQPNRYESQAGFAEQTRNNVPGRSPINARALDDELSGISQSINSIVGNLELIQRDDGSLKDATVHLHALSETVINLMGGFNLRGEWQANTNYAAKDIVDYQGHLFVCMTANQDAVFTAANWHRFGEKGAELHQVLRQVAHMQAQVQEEGRKALQAAVQTQQAAAQVASQAGTVNTSAQQAAASARAAKVSADAAEQARVGAEAAATSAESVVNNVSGKLSTKAEKEELKTLQQTLESKIAGIFSGQAQEIGYWRLSTGLILQWGKVASGWPGEGFYTVTFPVTFPNKCLNTQITVLSDGRKGSVNLDITIPVGTVRPVSFDALFNGIGYQGSTAADFKGFYWFAIGY